MSILITFYLRSQLHQRSESSVKDSHTFSPLWPQVMSLSVNLVMNSINVLRHQKFWTMHLFGSRYCKFPSGDEPISNKFIMRKFDILRWQCKKSDICCPCKWSLMYCTQCYNIRCHGNQAARCTIGCVRRLVFLSACFRWKDFREIHSMRGNKCCTCWEGARTSCFKLSRPQLISPKFIINPQSHAFLFCTKSNTSDSFSWQDSAK